MDRNGKYLSLAVNTWDQATTRWAIWKLWDSLSITFFTSCSSLITCWSFIVILLSKWSAFTNRHTWRAMDKTRVADLSKTLLCFWLQAINTGCTIGSIADWESWLSLGLILFGLIISLTSIGGSTVIAISMLMVMFVVVFMSVFKLYKRFWLILVAIFSWYTSWCFSTSLC